MLIKHLKIDKKKFVDKSLKFTIVSYI